MQYVDFRGGARVSSIRQRETKSHFLKVGGWFLFFGALGILAWLLVSKNGSLTPVSLITTITRPKPLLQTEGRTNILLVGMDTRSPGEFQTGNLTDTLMVVSFDQLTKQITMVSVPRDFYVAKFNTKINSVYSLYGGLPALMESITNITGLTIHYHVIIGFDGFVAGVDALGGLDINIPETLDDPYYPIPGRENSTCGLDAAATEEKALAEGFAPEFSFYCRFERLVVKQGWQHLDGALALKYARSRHADSDFGRARRQQLVLMAAKDKFLSLPTLTNIAKLQELYSTFQKSVQTDVTVGDLPQWLATAQKLTNVAPQSLVLSSEGLPETGGLLTGEILDGVGWVARPSGDNYLPIRQFIARSFIVPEASPAATPTP